MLPLTTKAVLRAVWSVCLLGSLILASSAYATTQSVYSSWIKNLSQDADPDHLYNHQNVKVAISGNYVHIVWHAFKNDFSGDEFIFYRRSADGGNTFSAPKKLAHVAPGGYSFQMPPEWNNLVASGPYVHLYYAQGWPERLIYLRSTDYGQSFAAPKIFVSGYLDVNGVYAYASQGNVYAAWATNADHSNNLYCTHSSNGGATNNHKLIAHDDDSDGKKIYTFSASDLASSGSNVYILYTVTDQNWFSSQAHLYLKSSIDGCNTVKAARRVNIKAVNGGYYATRTQDAHYSPNLAASGNSVNIVWINIDDPGSFDGWSAPTLRTRASTDAGSTLQAPKTLYTYTPGYHHGALPGLETIARYKGNVYITATMNPADHNGTYLWRSTDGGGSWSNGAQIMDGGWWPMLGINPLLPGNVYVANGWLFQSKNSAILFNGGFSPQLDFGGYNSPRFVVDSQNRLHSAGASNPRGQYMGNEIFYRRLVQAAPPAASNYALKLSKSAGDPPTPDHLQIPSMPSLQFGKAMTLEFWVKRQSDEWAFYENLVAKTRVYGESSYEMGAWNDFQIYSRLVTTGSTDSYYGNWLGSGITLPKGVWTHVAMTYNDALSSDNWRIYLNGELRAKTTLHGTILTDKGRLLIGDPKLASAISGSVLIDELRLWSVARSQAQIKNAMNRPLTAQDLGVTAYFNFNKSFKDMSGRGNDAFPKYHENFILNSPF